MRSKRCAVQNQGITLTLYAKFQFRAISLKRDISNYSFVSKTDFAGKTWQTESYKYSCG